MSLRRVLSWPDQSEFTALAFLRDREVFETKSKCPKLSESGQVCGKQMHEGVWNGESYWRFTRRGCNATKSVRAMNEFFIHRDQQWCIHWNIGSYTILELIWQWLYSISTTKQFALSASVSDKTVTEWFHHCRTTVGEDMESTEMVRGTEEIPIRIYEAKINKVEHFTVVCGISSISVNLMCNARSTMALYSDIAKLASQYWSSFGNKFHSHTSERTIWERFKHIFQHTHTLHLHILETPNSQLLDPCLI